VWSFPCRCQHNRMAQNIPQSRWNSQPVGRIVASQHCRDIRTQ
jgi:hypothetical protein